MMGELSRSNFYANLIGCFRIYNHHYVGSFAVSKIQTFSPSYSNCIIKQSFLGETERLSEHENLVRRTKNNIIELRYAFERQIEDLKKDSSHLVANIEKFKSRFATQLQ